MGELKIIRTFISYLLLIFVLAWSEVSFGGDNENSLSVTLDNHSPEFEVLWKGIVEIGNYNTESDRNSPTGNLTIAKEIKILKETTRIPLQKGIRFGIGYRFNGNGTNQSVRFKYKWLIPEPGIVNPGSDEVFLEYERERSCRVGKECRADWGLGENHLIPGEWQILFTKDGELLYKQKFELYVP